MACLNHATELCSCPDFKKYIRYFISQNVLCINYKQNDVNARYNKLPI